MDIQKEKNLYLAELLEREVIKKDEFDDIVFKTEINAFHSCYLSARFMDNINFGWSAWQAAKSQAVPEKTCSIQGHEIIINETKNELINDYDIAKEDEYLLEALVYRGVCIGKSQAVPEGFVLVSKDQFDSLCMFKDLYKRAIINARKRKDQLNWAHVAGLGVGSGRAVELCKMLNIDPSATNMHEVIQAQEQSHE